MSDSPCPQPLEHCRPSGIRSHLKDVSFGIGDVSNFNYSEISLSLSHRHQKRSAILKYIEVLHSCAFVSMGSNLAFGCQEEAVCPRGIPIQLLGKLISCSPKCWPNIGHHPSAAKLEMGISICKRMTIWTMATWCYMKLPVSSNIGYHRLQYLQYVFFLLHPWCETQDMSCIDLLAAGGWGYVQLICLQIRNCLSWNEQKVSAAG